MKVETGDSRSVRKAHTEETNTMKIDRQAGSSFYVVSVDAHELKMDSGKTLPYSTWIGVVHAETGKTQHWTPAAYVPRGYVSAAKAMLEQARAQLKTEGKVQ